MRTISDGNTFRPHLLLVVVLLTFVGAMRPIAARAQTCGADYTIREGETLAQIAARVYGNPAQWTIIFYANQNRLGTVLVTVRHGRLEMDWSASDLSDSVHRVRLRVSGSLLSQRFAAPIWCPSCRTTRLQAGSLPS